MTALDPRGAITGTGTAYTDLQDVPMLSLTDGLWARRLKPWDEQSQRLVSFRAAQRVTQRATSAPAPTVPTS